MVGTGQAARLEVRIGVSTYQPRDGGRASASRFKISLKDVGKLDEHIQFWKSEFVQGDHHGLGAASIDFLSADRERGRNRVGARTLSAE